MAGAGDIRAGRAFVELYAESSKLMSALKRIEGSFKALGTIMTNWGREMMRVGAAVVVPLAAVAKLAGHMGDEFYNMSKRTGISVETLTALDYAASQTGTSIEQVEVGIKKMQKTLAEAADGSAEATDSLAKLGLTVEQLRGMSPDEQFMRIAAAISAINSPAARAGIALKLFGRSGTELLPLFREGAAGMRELLNRAQELGLVMSTQDARAANLFNDKLAELWKIVKMTGFAIGSILIPPLTTVANLLEKTVGAAVKWIREHQRMVVLALGVGVALVSAGAALFILGKAIIFGVAVAKGLEVAMAALWAVLSLIGGGIAVLFTSPLLATLAVLVAVGAALLWLSGVGGKAITWLGRQFADLSNFVKTTFDGIADALLSGNIELAAQILWASIKIAFQTGVNAVHEVWRNFINGLEIAWVILKKFVGDTFDELVSDVIHKLVDATKKIASLLGGLDSSGVLKGVALGADYISRQVDAGMGIRKQDRAEQTGKEMFDILSDRMKLDAVDTAELDRLNAERDALLNKAKTAGPNLFGGIPPNPDEIPALGDIQKATFGTFNPAAVSAGGVGGGKMLESIATASKQTAKNTEYITQELEDLNTKTLGGTFT